MSQYPSLTCALAEALVDLAGFVESADDDHMDQVYFLVAIPSTTVCVARRPSRAKGPSGAEARRPRLSAGLRDCGNRRSRSA